MSLHGPHIFQIFKFTHYIKLSFLGQFLVGGQGRGGMAPMAPLGPPLGASIREGASIQINTVFVQNMKLLQPDVC